MTKRILLGAALIAALAGGSAMVAAQPPQGGPGLRGPGGPGPGPRRVGPGLDLGLRGIELTDAQRDQLRSIMESHKAELDAVGSKVREAHRAFAEATIEASPIDEATVRARSAAVATAMADEAILRAKVRAEAQSILTAEQLEQLKQRRAEMEKRRQQLQPRRRGR
jgi:periplasmic protein CpxP/Spy